MKRENFGSRLGFILVSAGCAIGLGNVWKFPYMAGQYGGAAFILIYLLFLVILGLPIIVCEFSVGRASQKSIATSYNVLEPKGTRWHFTRWFAIAGNYLLVMFYSMVGGWMLYYCFRMAKGEFAGIDSTVVSAKYDSMLESPVTLTFWTILVILLAFWICSIGLQKGVEKIMKITMLCLLAIMVVLAIRSVTLPGAAEGLRFYLIPDFGKVLENGVGNVIFGAMSQAFFTLSIGMGGMAIFGSYLDKSRSLTGESLSILLLDTCVALTAGLIVFPACFSFNVQPDAGAQTCIYHSSEHFHSDAGRTSLGGSVFPLPFLCNPVHDRRRIRKHCFLRDRSFWIQPQKICRHQHCTYYCIKYSLYSRLQYFIGDTTARSRVEHYGFRRFPCVKQYPSSWFRYISYVLYTQKRLGMEQFHSGGKCRKRIEISSIYP